MSSPTHALEAGLRRAVSEHRFGPLVDGIVQAIGDVGLPVDRAQLPLALFSGFRHPLLASVRLTWTCEEGTHAEPFTHDAETFGTRPSQSEVVRGSPYEPLIVEGLDLVRHRLDGPQTIPMLEELAARGYVDYVALALPLPNGARQPLSLASRTPMPDDAEARLRPWIGTLATTVFAACQEQVAREVARTYIGPSTGERVLQGEMTRGHVRSIEAGILFCDVRGFTALSEALGAAGVVRVVNRVFEIVGASARAARGEILKFMGDAVLIVLPIEDGHGADPDARAKVASAMVGAAASCIAGVEALAAETGHSLGVGFGGHLGEVVYGNIGTPDRLDFTVMGPAVNLASRLESSCKTLGVAAVFSPEVAAAAPEAGLVPLGDLSLKGVSAPVAAFGLRGAGPGPPAEPSA